MKQPLRFNLKTLLVIVTLYAITCATIWQFWPRYRAYRTRMRFEAASARLRAGMSLDDIGQIVGYGAWNSYSNDATGQMVGLTPYFFDGGWYCIYAVLDSDTRESICGRMPSKSIKTYRLALPPLDYLSQTRAAKYEVKPPKSSKTRQVTAQGPIEIPTPPKVGEDARRSACIQDFYEHISRRTKADLKISYEQLPQNQ